MRERLGAGFREIGRVSDGFYRFLLHLNLLPRLRRIGDALELQQWSIYAWRIDIRNRGFGKKSVNELQNDDGEADTGPEGRLRPGRLAISTGRTGDSSYCDRTNASLVLSLIAIAKRRRRF